MDDRILAPPQYDGTMDSILFETWFETMLMVELSGSSAIVTDNAAFHRRPRLIPIAEKYGHRLIFLPPYSPEPSSIENFWAWLKAKLRKALAGFSCFDDALCYCFEGI